MVNPQVHYINYPCPLKLNILNVSALRGQIKDEYSYPPYLAKYLKKCHPGDILNYKRSICDLQGTNKYPLKDVKAQYRQSHVPPAVDPSTRSSLSECSNAGQSTASRVAKEIDGDGWRYGYAPYHDNGMATHISVQSHPFSSTSSQWGKDRRKDVNNTDEQVPYAVSAGPSTMKSMTTSTTARKSRKEKRV